MDGSEGVLNKLNSQYVDYCCRRISKKLRRFYLIHHCGGKFTFWVVTVQTWKSHHPYPDGDIYNLFRLRHMKLIEFFLLGFRRGSSFVLYLFPEFLILISNNQSDSLNNVLMDTEMFQFYAGDIVIRHIFPNLMYNSATFQQFVACVQYELYISMVMYSQKKASLN